MSPHIFKGPPTSFEEFQGSLGEFLYQKIKSHPPQSVLQVNGLTGEGETVEEVLRDGLEVATGLRDRGVGAGDVVVLSGNYSRHYFAVVLGTILQNATIFPINPAFKQAEMENMFKVVPPKIVFADNQPSFYITAALQALGNKAEVVLMDEEPEPNERIRKYEDIVSNADNYELCPIADPANEIAAILHSSGTTGNAKAIAMPHNNIIWNLQIWNDVKSTKCKMVNLQATNGSWIVGFLLTLKSLVFGFKRVYVVPNTAENLVKAIHRERPEWFFMAPYSLQEILSLPDLEKYDLSSIKHIMSGGAPPAKNLDALFYEKVNNSKGVALEQSYGSTELGYYTEVCSGIAFESTGKIIRGMSAKVLDIKTGEVLGPNETGELRIRADYPFIKYYAGNPEETSKAFDSEGFFKTGDVGWISENNQYYVTGRIKDLIQTKLGRVTPWVLEKHIMEIEGVKEVVVVGIPEIGDPTCCQIAAAVTRQPKSQVTEQQIQQYVQDHLSGMNNLNGGVKIISKLPRNSNGKLERNRILELFAA